MDQQTPPTQHPHVPPAKKGGMSVGWIVAIVVGLGVVLVGLPCGALFVGIMLPALGAAREAAREAAQEAQLQANLRTVHEAMVVYALDNAGAFPPAEGWADVLVDGGFLTPSELVSPASDGVGPDYFYVPAASAAERAGTSRRVLLYEDPAHHQGGVPVLFIDGTTELVPQGEFERLISGIVLPDGTVYEPGHGP